MHGGDRRNLSPAILASNFLVSLLAAVSWRIPSFTSLYPTWITVELMGTTGVSRGRATATRFISLIARTTLTIGRPFGIRLFNCNSNRPPQERYPCIGVKIGMSSSVSIHVWTHGTAATFGPTLLPVARFFSEIRAPSSRGTASDRESNGTVATDKSFCFIPFCLLTLLSLVPYAPSPSTPLLYYVPSNFFVWKNVCAVGVTIILLVLESI